MLWVRGVHPDRLALEYPQAPPREGPRQPWPGPLSPGCGARAARESVGRWWTRCPRSFGRMRRTTSRGRLFPR